MSPEAVLEKKINNRGWYDSYLYYKRTSIGYSNIEIEIGIQNPPRTWRLDAISGNHWTKAYAYFRENNIKVNIRLLWCGFEDDQDFSCLEWLLISSTTNNVTLVNHYTENEKDIEGIKKRYDNKLTIENTVRNKIL